MLSPFWLKTLTTVAAFILTLESAVHAAALVGDTRHIVVQAVVSPTFDKLKSDYRRPDTIPFPKSNPYTTEKVQLGKALFYDTRLSGSGALSCASCHNPGFAFGDGRAKSLGDRMNPLNRRSPSVINSAWGQIFMWDGRSASLEDQVRGPIEASAEMNQSLETLVHTLSDINEYRSLFTAAFPDQSITSQTIASAIATYERTIVSETAPFDKWIDGNKAAISGSAERGFQLFNTKAQCASCHGGWQFTDDGFHDIGLPDDDTGRGRLFPSVLAMQHAFKTPSLRETARRGPYMHDGSLPTLEAVVAHYNQGGMKRPSQSELIVPLDLSADEQGDIVAFLRTLTSAVRTGSAPVLPR